MDDFLRGHIGKQLASLRNQDEIVSISDGRELLGEFDGIQLGAYEAQRWQDYVDSIMPWHRCGFWRCVQEALAHQLPLMRLSHPDGLNVSRCFSHSLSDTKSLFVLRK